MYVESTTNCLFTMLFLLLAVYFALPLCTFADKALKVPHNCRILMFAWQKEYLLH